MLDTLHTDTCSYRGKNVGNKGEIYFEWVVSDIRWCPFQNNGLSQLSIGSCLWCVFKYKIYWFCMIFYILFVMHFSFKANLKGMYGMGFDGWWWVPWGWIQWYVGILKNTGEPMQGFENWCDMVILLFSPDGVLETLNTLPRDLNEQCIAVNQPGGNNDSISNSKRRAEFGNVLEM